MDERQQPITVNDVRARLDKVQKWLTEVRNELESSAVVDETAYQRWRYEAVRPLAKDCRVTPTVDEVRQRLDEIGAWVKDTLAWVASLGDGTTVVPGGEYETWKMRGMDLRPLAKDC